MRGFVQTDFVFLLSVFWACMKRFALQGAIYNYLKSQNWFFSKYVT